MDSRRQKIWRQLIEIEERIFHQYPTLKELTLLYEDFIDGLLDLEEMVSEIQKLNVEAPDCLIRTSYWLCEAEYNLKHGRLKRKQMKYVKVKFLRLEFLLSQKQKEIINELDELHTSPRKCVIMAEDLEKMSTLKSLQAIVSDLIRDLGSLYQNIHEKATQEAVERLLQLLVWSLWITNYLFESACCGGFGNLLLDAWWLEFWEIVLLVAGDVERNPGPRQITGKLMNFSNIASLILFVLLLYTDAQLAKVDNRVLGKQNCVLSDFCY